MKKIIAVIILALALTGCSTPQTNGTCALMAHGVCLSTWVDGEQVPSGEVDVRFDGLKMQGKELTGTVKVHKSKQWDIKK
ncbi:lipoprotein [Klebsiella michiganensis]|uniref:lipoprotein n=1 Tax=Klebsiella michiganensis TaxID=1134687 RepID=UPI0027F8EFFC|nr:hypothetical protein [Klebsiella pneumoniae]HDT5885590.1 lipoprotein [Klebsiella pneumoniae subsp. pneumoniae]HDT5929626.1 lipoprotein [Klebsiella pneumoniae subsp. pneumoniae]HDT6023215.1 lipoprotein [Klebsiella pneumoniae subsp. pneumoniae]HDT6059082.1 lipoprotein [Klebsiella pneumoniae subsp. pneumoniae]